MVSISSETNGMMNHSQLIQVYTLRNHTHLFYSKGIEFQLIAFFYGLFYGPSDFSQLKHLSGDPWPPPCQRARQEVLEEVLLCLEEVWSLLLQQGDFKGQ